METFGETPILDPFSVYIILVMMVGLLILLPLGLFYFAFVNKGYKRVGTYLGGANIDNVTFEGAMGSTQTIELKNYYLEKFFGENVLFNAGVFVSLILLFIMFGVAII
jgi:ech hydrogenase subunit A